jgi:hypothetical protein
VNAFQDITLALSNYTSITNVTPWSKVLLEKLTVPQLVKIFPAFYGNRRFITAFITSRHLSISCARSAQSTPRSTDYFVFHVTANTPIYT